ncbi:MAG: hypothetical protein U5L00_13170 [Desulfovermiculus sp.]|nr:hypothetical protein [Desulfovermiculus sp.]
MFISKPQFPSLVSGAISEEITDRDEAIFWRITNTALSPDQEKQLCSPDEIFPGQREVLAVHWHPEFVPIHLAIHRMQAMFPNWEHKLVIPTQHNVLLSHAGYSGVEVDCFSQRFNQKVQLLLHLAHDKIDKAGALQSMLTHTRQYRATQLFDLVRTFTQPVQERLDLAARQTGADEELIRFISLYVHKLESLLHSHFQELPLEMIKNKMVRNFFHALRPMYTPQLIDRAQNFIQAVKQAVKQTFPLEYFFRTSEIIEEARSLGAGIVVPHPEQFWPILLADYEVDGYEVWNPQSQRYTDFLISVVQEKNRQRPAWKPPLLVFMGDDTHIGEKVKDAEEADAVKAGREVGYQPAWDDWKVRKRLLQNSISRETVISEYTSRLQTR